MSRQKQYELRVEGRGTCEFRATRPYGVGDSLPLPLAHEDGGECDRGVVWTVVSVRPAGREHLDAILVLEPALAA
jgi:hypothetical protein